MYRNSPVVAEADQPAAGQSWQPGDVAAELRDVLAHLKRRRFLIGLMALAGALLGLAAVPALPRLYTATSQIMVDPRGLRVFENQSVVPAGQVPDVQSSLVETQAEVLKSDSILRPVVEQQRLASDPEFDGEPRSWVGAAWRRLRGVFSRRKADDPGAVALAKLDDMVRVQRVPGSFVLELSVRSEDAEKAARLARAITQVFIAKQDEARQDAAQRVSEGLDMRLDELSAEVNRAEKAVDDFKRRNNIVGANGQLVNEQRLGELTNQLTNARVHTGELRARYEQIQAVQRAGGVPDATAEAVQSPTITALRTRYAEAKQIEDNLLSTVGPRHPSLIAAHAQTAGLRKLIADEIGRIAAAARSDYERASASEQTLSNEVGTVTRETGTVNTAEIRSRELEREAQARRAVYESFLTRSRETREQADLPLDNISVISAATAPLKPGGLPPLLIVLIAAAFGASAGSTGALVLDRLRGRLTTPRQLGLATGLPMLAVARRRGGGSRGLFGPSRKAARISMLPTSAQDLATLRNALDDIAPPVEPRIILFISGAGKAADAWLPVDLAGSICEAGSRVLFIDTDQDAMTRPLQTGPARDQKRWPEIKQTGIRNLSVLSWRGILAQPSVGESGVSGAFPRLAADHDFVFIHASVHGSALRLRTMATTATNIVLIIDSDAAVLSDVEAIRQDVGPCASKVGGFIWVSGAPEKPGVPRVARTESRLAANRHEKALPAVPSDAAA